LIDAYDLEVEVSRIPLLDAMLALGARDAVSALSLSDDVSERILATRLARALPDPTHLESLERLAQDADPVVAQMARAALWGQVHDARWKAAVARLASSSRAEVREATSAWLSERQAARHVG
jgi:aminopeptidase N